MATALPVCRTARQAKRAGPKLEAGPQASAERSEGTMEARQGRDAAGGSMRYAHDSATGHLPGGRGRPHSYGVHVLRPNGACHDGRTRTTGRLADRSSPGVATASTAWRESRTRYRARTRTRSAPPLRHTWNPWATTPVLCAAAGGAAATGAATLEALVRRHHHGG